MTDNPRSNSDKNQYYMPKSLSLYNWTHVSDIQGIEEPLEYYYYSTEPVFWSPAQNTTYGTPPKLNVTQVLNMTDSEYTWYGLTNVYNAGMISKTSN